MLLELVAYFFVKDPLLFPRPSRSLLRAMVMVFESEFQLHLFSTLKETLAATSMAVLVGVPAGLAMGRLGFLRSLVESPLDWMRSVPATALFPALMLVFGLGRPTRIAIAVYAAFFAVLIPSMYSASQADYQRIMHLRRAGLNSIEIFVHSIFWEALPGILSGVRLAISSALVLVVVGEMFIGSNKGLGFQIVFYQGRYETTSMYAAIFLVGALGFFLNRLVLAMESRVRQDESASVH